MRTKIYSREVSGGAKVRIVKLRQLTLDPQPQGSHLSVLGRCVKTLGGANRGRQPCKCIRL